MNPYEVFVRLAVFIGSGLAIAGLGAGVANSTDEKAPPLAAFGFAFFMLAMWWAAW